MKNTILTCISVFFILAATSVFAQSEVRPFNGNNFNNWKLVDADARNFWVVSYGTAAICREDSRALVPRAFTEGETEPVMLSLCGPEWRNNEQHRGVDIYTEQTFGDCILEIEFMVAEDSNSGIYMMGEYELQVCDSFGKTEELELWDAGAIYSAAAPKVNASLPPGEWQKYVIDFQAPRFDADGNKTANAKFLKVTLNGVVVQENVEVLKSTGGELTGKEHAKGPLMLQGNHGPVAYRNIVIKEK